jgi:hypothetical protein
MTQTTDDRIRVPFVMAVGGTAIAAATFLGGRGLSGAALVEAFTVIATVGYYYLGGRDTDTGALVGARADERQADLGLRASAFAGQTMAAFALGGFVIQTARGASAWPFGLLCAVGGFSFVSAAASRRRS